MNLMAADVVEPEEPGITVRIRVGVEVRYA
jgi:hypothetical protein